MRAIVFSPLLGLLAFQGVARAAEEATRSNHLPKIALRVGTQPEISDASGGLDSVLRSGRSVRITFSAEDPDDDPLTYALTPVPAGASFDQQQGILTWLPTRAQEGKHEIRLEVSDGRLTTKRTFTFFVTPNRAPVATASEPVAYKTVRAERAAANEADSFVSLATDPDGDDLSYAVKKLPSGARIVATHASAAFVWSPTAADVGEHQIVVEVSDGELRTTIRKTVVVMPEWEERDYRRWFLLGGGPSAFLSHGDAGAFFGGAVDVTLVALREGGAEGDACARGLRHYECHASHHRFYAQFEVLDALRSGAPSLFTYAAGYSASLEWRPARHYLIPHYGIDVGGLVRAGVGHRAQVHPYLGLHLWASDAVWVDATLGYRVTPADLLDLSGPTVALRAVLNPW